MDKLKAFLQAFSPITDEEFVILASILTNHG
jgi:hypothetical protein